MEQSRTIAVLGSTGSIGTQALEVVRANSDLYRVTALTANGSWEKLAQQALQFRPRCVVIADKSNYGNLKNALSGSGISILAGDDAVCDCIGMSEADTVLNALVGYAGLMPTLTALESGKKLALANKESLVVAGDIVMRAARDNGVGIIPVDSEHSAIFQCLNGEPTTFSKLILTASGGPFRDTPAHMMKDVTVKQALAHPNWDMGAKITIDSATMLNKGFEVIEARWLFDATPSQIEVVVHPQSIIHSMVEFPDGAVMAQMGLPDMKLPIQYALTYPRRMKLSSPRFSFSDCSVLDFIKPDMEKFPALRLAFECLEKGGNSGCILNGANEIAVRAFLDGRLRFDRIAHILYRTLSHCDFIATPTLEDYRQSNTRAREMAALFVNEE